MATLMRSDSSDPKVTGWLVPYETGTHKVPSFQLVPAVSAPLTDPTPKAAGECASTSLVPRVRDDTERCMLLRNWNCGRRTRAVIEEYERLLNGLEATSEERLKDDVLFVCTYWIAWFVTARRIWGDREMAHDAAIDTVCRVREKYDPKQGVPLQPYVRKEANYAALSHLRKAKRRWELFVSHDVDSVPDPRAGGRPPLPAYFETALRSAWNDAYRSLTPQQQQVMGPHVDQGLSFVKIAADLGITEGAARVRASRARERLQEHNALQSLVATLIAQTS